MTLSDYVISLVRTAVPVGIGALLTWLAARTGIVLDEQSSTGLTVGTTALAAGGYYALVRALEARVPWIGVLLGKRAEPVYGLPPAETESTAEYDNTGRLRQTRSITTWPPRSQQHR